MVRKVERTVEALGILCLASLLPMGILLLLHTSDGQKAVLENYVSMPFWLSVALLCLLCAACFAAGAWKGKDWQDKLLCSAGALALAAIGLLTIAGRVVDPLSDLPYLQAPSQIQLEDVRFSYSNLGDTPTVQLEGLDEQGKRESFSISRGVYAQGEALYEQAGAGNGTHTITAQIAYLPHSETVVHVDLQLAGSAED